MAGCFGSHPVDRWMEGQLNRYLDAQDQPPNEFEFDFNTKFRGGVVKVFCKSETETDYDEDGPSKCLYTAIVNMCWTFDEEAETNWTPEEEKELQSLIDEKAQEELQNY